MRLPGFEVIVKDEPDTEADIVLIYTTPDKVPQWTASDIGAPLMYLLDFDDNLVLTCPTDA